MSRNIVINVNIHPATSLLAMRCYHRPVTNANLSTHHMARCSHCLAWPPKLSLTCCNLFLLTSLAESMTTVNSSVTFRAKSRLVL